MINIITYVLDDDREELELLKPHLDRVCGCNLQLFTDAEAFIEAIDEGVHICIIDHRLNAGIDGIEVGKRVLDKNEYAFLMLYSGSSDKRVWQQATNAGFRRLIDKNEPGAIEKIAAFVAEEIPTITHKIERWEIVKCTYEKYRHYA